MSETRRRRRSVEVGFTLMEILGVVAVFGILFVAFTPSLMRALNEGKAAKSMGNLRQLATANLSYAVDNDGFYCPAQDRQNRTRWHGGRSSSSGAFDPTKGYLAPYLGQSRQIRTCPLFLDMLKGGASFEDGSGGYGYNAAYIGGTPANPYLPATVASVVHPARTVMFTTTAFARAGGLQEYPYAEPPEWVDPNGLPGGRLQPSVHFRAEGKALVAWCDGHVTAEEPAQLGGVEYYSGNSTKALIGFFGPLRDNGYWNPNFEP
jgi:prepilin-type processing-associated H-X9-DG protein